MSLAPRRSATGAFVRSPLGALTCVSSRKVIARNDSYTGNLETDPPDILHNDTYNGQPATTGNVDISVVTPATPKTPGASVPALNTSTGKVSWTSSVPDGNYSIVYKITDKTNSSSFDTAKISISVVQEEIETTDPEEEPVCPPGGIPEPDEKAEVPEGPFLPPDSTTPIYVDSFKLAVYPWTYGDTVELYNRVMSNESYTVEENLHPSGWITGYSISFPGTNIPGIILPPSYSTTGLPTQGMFWDGDVVAVNPTYVYEYSHSEGDSSNPILWYRYIRTVDISTYPYLPHQYSVWLDKLSEYDGLQPYYSSGGEGNGYRRAFVKEWIKAATWDDENNYAYKYGFSSDTIDHTKAAYGSYDPKYTTASVPPNNGNFLVSTKEYRPIMGDIYLLNDVTWYDGENPDRPDGSLTTINARSPYGCYAMSGTVDEGIGGSRTRSAESCLIRRAGGLNFGGLNFNDYMPGHLRVCCSL